MIAEPLPICYLDGEYPLLEAARISPLDRGFLFADSVYEVLAVFSGRPYRFREHFERLDRSLREIRIELPHSHQQWLAILEGLIARNPKQNFYVYLQVTRGKEYGRNHAFPMQTKPTVFAMCSPLPELSAEQRELGMSAITIEDFRWARCDIKSTMLLANVLMKQSASDAGANEAIIVSNGEVLEGASTSVYAVKNQTLITPPNSNRILPGTTRDAVLDLARGRLATQIRSLTVSEMMAADEVWIAAATRDVLPITRIDGKRIGDGKVGPLWRQMTEWFAADRQRLAGLPVL
jgi:D-alanine transaminase